MTEKNNSNSLSIDNLHLNNEEHPTEETKGLKDSDNPLDPINNYHYLAKRFIRTHGGYDRDTLQDWLNLFWFMTNGPKDRYDKVLLFIEIAILAPRRVKYRDVISHKSTK